MKLVLIIKISLQKEENNENPGRHFDIQRQLEHFPIIINITIFLTHRIMNKKNYQKPTMNIVKLQQQTHLMAGSGVRSTRDSYGEANSNVSSTELNDNGDWEWN